MPDQESEFDVFLSHNSKDKPLVEEIARILRDEYHLKPWLDKWVRIAGTPWQEMLEEGLKNSATVAVFLGEAGFGKWENEEMRAAVDAVVAARTTRVIPVLLPGTPDDPEMSIFLKRYTWVDLRISGYQAKDALLELVGGITNTSMGDRGAASSQTQGSGQSAEHLRQLRAENVRPESNKGIEISQQFARNPFRRDESANPKPPTPEELIISRKQLANLREAQGVLKDFVDAYIKFSESWVECDKVYSKLRALLEHPTDEISSPMYWNDIKSALRHAKTKVGAEAPDFLKEFLQSKSEFSQFNQALDGAINLLDTIPKTSKSKKIEVIGEAHNLLDTSVIAMEAIVGACRDGARDKLKEIKVVMDTIFEAEPIPSPEASTPPQESHRYIHRPPTSEDKAESQQNLNLPIR